MAEILRPLENAFRATIDTTYRNIVHPYLTHGKAREDREIAHERAVRIAEYLQENSIAMKAAHTLFTYDDPLLQTTFAGIESSNPLGIAAGFDKNAHIHRFLGEGQGFGIVTVGSITQIPYEGNTRPRIFDLPNSEGLINRMGFPGAGADEADQILAQDNLPRDYTLVVNLAASKPSFEKGTAVDDYVAVAKQLLPYGDIHEINVSSPNTPGVRGLQEPELFAELASGIEDVYRAEDGSIIKPYIFKFGPDLTHDHLLQDIRTAVDHGAAGVTLTNTSTDPAIQQSLRPDDNYRNEVGGISGLPLKEKALAVSNVVFEYTGGTVPIKRSGGIQTAEDMWHALSYGGATVAEVYSAFVKRDSSTPNFTHHVLSELARAMRAEDMKSMDDFAEIRGKRSPYPKVKD